MIEIPIVILITATVGLGIYMGLRYLKRIRNTPMIIGTHFLLGAATLEPMVIVLHGGVNGHAKAPIFGVLSAAFVGLALMSGATAVMIGRQSRRTADIALASHAGLAATAFFLMVAWVLKL